MAEYRVRPPPQYRMQPPQVRLQDWMANRQWSEENRASPLPDLIAEFLAAQKLPGVGPATSQWSMSTERPLGPATPLPEFYPPALTGQKIPAPSTLPPSFASNYPEQNFGVPASSLNAQTYQISPQSNITDPRVIAALKPSLQTSAQGLISEMPGATAAQRPELEASAQGLISEMQLPPAALPGGQQTVTASEPAQSDVRSTVVKDETLQGLSPLEQLMQQISIASGDMRGTVPGMIAAGIGPGFTPRTQTQSELYWGLQEARRRDTMTDQERQQLQQETNIAIPKGTTWTEYNDRLRNISGMRASQSLQQYRDRRIELAQAQEMRRWEQMDRLEQNRQKLDLKRWTLTPSQSEEGEKLLNSSKGLMRLESLYNMSKDRGDTLGPFWGRINSLARKIGLGSKDYVSIESELNDAVGEYLTLRTGAQRGMTEVRWLMTVFPGLFEHATSWETLLPQLRERLNEAIESKITFWDAEGYRTEGFKAAKRAMSGESQEDSGGKVRVRVRFKNKEGGFSETEQMWTREDIERENEGLEEGESIEEI